MKGDLVQRLGRRARRGAALAWLLAAAVGDARAQMPGMPEMKQMMRWEPTLFVLFEELEYSPAGEGRPLDVEGIAWYGDAYNRLWVRLQAEQATTNRQGQADAQVMYGRLVAPYWDAVAGLRVDKGWGGGNPERLQLAVGLIGLAPYRFEFQPTIFVSHRGEISARLEAAYQFLITQRLIAEPKAELNAALQAVPRFDIARGLNDYDVGVRLRYEFRREIAPYVGVSGSRRVGGSASLARAIGEPIAENRFLVGMRLWR